MLVLSAAEWKAKSIDEYLAMDSQDKHKVWLCIELLRTSCPGYLDLTLKELRECGADITPAEYVALRAACVRSAIECCKSDIRHTQVPGYAEHVLTTLLRHANEVGMIISQREIDDLMEQHRRVDPLIAALPGGRVIDL